VDCNCSNTIYLSPNQVEIILSGEKKELYEFQLCVHNLSTICYRKITNKIFVEFACLIM
jgi:hypothetical protein